MYRRVSVLPLLAVAAFFACKKAQEPATAPQPPRRPAIVFENPGDPFGSPQSQQFGLTPEAKGLLGDIQPILAEAYNAHITGDYAKSLPAFRRYFERMVELWPHSQSLVSYFFEGRPPGSGSFEPLPTRRVVELTLADLKGAATRPGSAVDADTVKAICGLLRRHFINFTSEPIIAEVERRMTVAARPPRDIGELLEAVKQEAADGFRAEFNSEKYEADNTDLLATAARSTDTAWAAYLTFLAGQRHVKVIGSTYGLPDSPQQAIDAFTLVISSYAGATFPMDDPLSRAPKGKPIEPYARILLARIYSNWLEGNTVRAKNEPAAEHLEVILEKFDDTSITTAGPSDHLTPVMANAMIGLLRIYGTSEKAVALAEKFMTKYPSMPFAWNGWWLGETRPEALQLLASVEKDEKKKSSILMRIIEEYPKSWTGKAGSDDGGTYSEAAYHELLGLAKTDKDKLDFYKKIIASRADKRLKEEAMFPLAESLEAAGDQAGAIKIYKTLAPNYLEIKPLNYDYQTARTKAAHRLWEIEGKIKPGEYVQPEY